MSKKQYSDDDGRQIADMRGLSEINYVGWGNIRKLRRPITKKIDEDGKVQANIALDPPMTKKETWSLVLSSMLAALSIAMIFIVGAFLFILFCIYVWFK